MDHTHKPSSFLTYESWHRSTLRSLSNPVDEEMLLYSYNHAMHGFSARLTPSQVSEIKKSPAHIATHEERFGKLFTTHSPEFLGLRHSSGLWNASSYGEGVIIGLIDSGVWPESESFNEKGMPSIPSRWKGKCRIVQAVLFLATESSLVPKHLSKESKLLVKQTRQMIHLETSWDMEHTHHLQPQVTMSRCKSIWICKGHSQRNCTTCTCCYVQSLSWSIYRR